MARGADGMWCLAAAFEPTTEDFQPAGEVVLAEQFALARALEASSDQDHAQIAEHYSRAGDSRGALLHLRRAAAQERRRREPDENRVNQLLEAALVELRPVVELSPKGRRVALRLGYKLLRRLSKAADHNSVHALSRELTAWCAPAQSRLEAKIRRVDALSYRVVGENAEALQQLQLALSCLDRASEGSPRLNERERIFNRLAASWAHYSAHDGESSLAAARSTFASVRTVGTPAQRAEALLHAGNALALIERYRCSSRVVRLERRAVAVLRRHAAPALAQVSAQGNLAFILLLGDASQCREAVEIYEGISAKAREAGDVLELTRVATYLAVGYRRVGRLAECEAQSRLTLELSRQCGQPGYVGVARGCLGWLALRRSETELATSECRAALQVWQRRRSVDPSRTTEYPFQWLGILPLVAGQVASESAANCAAWLDDLLHPTQARLAQPLQACLEQGATEGPDWNAEAWDDWGERVVRLASAHRYL
jgi:tetratricopeptide (TPR) repeat protein